MRCLRSILWLSIKKDLGRSCGYPISDARWVSAAVVTKQLAAKKRAVVTAFLTV